MTTQTTDAVDSRSYNGWTNYETWCVNLWLTNESSTVDYWAEEIERIKAEAPNCEQVQDGVWSVTDAERIMLADALKDSFETFHPYRGEHLNEPRESDVFSDLLDAALSEVNWQEIARSFLASD